MNVAALALCKELYELRGWDDTAMLWAPSPNGWALIHSDWDTINNRDCLPAYDLGYLMHKLLAIGSVDLSWVQPKGTNVLDMFPYSPYSHLHKSLYGGTYEDLAAQCCIYLLKNGALPKETKE